MRESAAAVVAAAAATGLVHVLVHVRPSFLISMDIYASHRAGRIDVCQYEAMRKVIATLSDCCSPISGTALSADEAARTAGLFKLLADPTRLRLVSLIAASEDGTACVCDLPDALGVSQPTVSHHLKALHQGGLVTREQRGKWAYYAIERDAMQALGQVLAT